LRPGRARGSAPSSLRSLLPPESARTRETGGAGLGLAIVKSCIEACGGTVAVRNVKPSGLQVDFILRRA